MAARDPIDARGLRRLDPAGRQQRHGVGIGEWRELEYPECAAPRHLQPRRERRIASAEDDVDVRRQGGDKGSTQPRVEQAQRIDIVEDEHDTPELAEPPRSVVARRDVAARSAAELPEETTLRRLDAWAVDAHDNRAGS